ncbi:MAG: hypothetical protein H0W96_17440, partial [Solirubrobacterales bacterium]|nr:hypothetical protein [Solirubrobacterales bacterium]
LTIACPASGKPGVYAITGSLTPVRNGVDVELHVTPPASVEALQMTKTNANGLYSAGVAMQATGTWSIFARWAGDAGTQPDDSPICETTITP